MVPLLFVMDNIISALFVMSVLHYELSLAMDLAVFAKSDQNYNGKVEFAGALNSVLAKSLRRCVNLCLQNDKCVTIFYNSISTQCVMHSKAFIFDTPSGSDTGWKYYIITDATGRCPFPFIYYRHLDFCYIIDYKTAIEFTEMKTRCTDKGGRLAAIDSQEKHDYFKLILTNRMYSRVGLGGDRISTNEWVQLNGQPLTYFDWFPGEPSSSNSLCLQLKTHDLIFDCSCGGPQDRVFICEI